MLVLLKTERKMKGTHPAQFCKQCLKKKKDSEFFQTFFYFLSLRWKSELKLKGSPVGILILIQGFDCVQRGMGSKVKGAPKRDGQSFAIDDFMKFGIGTAIKVELDSN